MIVHTGKESPVPSDSLLTVDLKSGSKINIDTNGITLDKFFEGNLKATKSLDLVKLIVSSYILHDAFLTFVVAT